MGTGSSPHLLCNVSNKRQGALPASQSIFLVLNRQMVAEIAGGRPYSVAAPHPFSRLAAATRDGSPRNPTPTIPLELWILLAWPTTNQLEFRGGLVRCGLFKSERIN